MRPRIALAIGGGCVVLLLAWFQFLWSPRGDDLTAANAKRTAAEVQVAALQTKLAHLRSSQAVAPRLEADRERLRAAVPDGPELSGFLLEANDAASKAGVTFVSIAPTPPTASTAGGPTEIHLAISVKGGYHQVLDYLDRLLALPRVVVLDAVQASPGGDAGSDPSLSVNLTGRLFTSAPVAAPAGATTPTTSPGAPPVTTTSTTTPPTTAAPR